MPERPFRGLGNIAIIPAVMTVMQQLTETLAARPIAAGDAWALGEFLCSAGPEHAAYEERHDGVTIAAVIGGSFTYRTEAGTALLHPGALMLGQAGACFECGHEHSRGDRCVAFHYSSEFFAEIAASRAGSARFRFSHAMLPARKETLALVARLEALAQHPGPAAEEAAIALAEQVLTATSGKAPERMALSARDHRRVSAVLRLMEERCAEPLGLDDLAAAACMSRYHFLRGFRRITGSAPYEYLLGLRLRRAAQRLRASDEAVAAIAYDAGFGDLSTFNARFKAVFGAPPGGYRRSS